MSGDAQKVKNVQLNVTGLTRYREIVPLDATSTRLEKLVIVEADRGTHNFVTINQISSPVYHFYKEACPRSDPSQDNNKRPWLKIWVENEIKRRGGSLDNWRPPSILIGTESQYARLEAAIDFWLRDRNIDAQATDKCRKVANTSWVLKSRYTMSPLDPTPPLVNDYAS